MPVPNTMADLSTLAGSNSPQGTETVFPDLDNYVRGLSAITRSIYAVSASTIAAASTTDLATSSGEHVNVTGSATITSLGTGFAGCRREVKFSAACTLTHSANLLLPNAANITTAANDVYSFRCLAAGQWIQTSQSSGQVTLSTAQTISATKTFSAQQNFTGINFGSALSVGNNLANHLALYSTTYGLNVVAGAVQLVHNSIVHSSWTAAGYSVAGDIFASGNLTGVNVTASGVMTPAGGINPGSSKLLSKITVSSSAPGALANGELFLRY